MNSIGSNPEAIADQLQQLEQTTVCVSNAIWMASQTRDGHQSACIFAIQPKISVFQAE